MLIDQSLIVATLRVRGTHEGSIFAFSRLEPTLSAATVELLGTDPLILTSVLFPFSLGPVVINTEQFLKFAHFCNKRSVMVDYQCSLNEIYT